MNNIVVAVPKLILNGNELIEDIPKSDFIASILPNASNNIPPKYTNIYFYRFIVFIYLLSFNTVIKFYLHI